MRVRDLSAVASGEVPHPVQHEVAHRRPGRGLCGQIAVVVLVQLFVIVGESVADGDVPALQGVRVVPLLEAVAVAVGEVQAGRVAWQFTGWACESAAYPGSVAGRCDR